MSILNNPAGNMKPGNIIASPASAVSGYLFCNGATVSRTVYAGLYAKIGTKYGSGDGSTTFNLPDFRGCFLRGYLSGTSAAIGTKQAEGLPNITGVSSAFSYGALEDTATGAFDWVGNVGNAPAAGTVVAANAVRFTASKSNAIYNGSHVTPLNHAINYFIKY